MQRLEDGDGHTGFGEVARASQTRRTRADDGGALAGAARGFSRLIPTAPHGGVRDKTLQPADSHRRILDADHARHFALRFLRAHAAAHGGQRIGALEDAIGLADIAAREGGDESGDIDGHGAAWNAARLLAAQATVGFGQCGFKVQAQVDLFEIVGAFLGGLFGHVGAHRGDGADVFGQARAGRLRLGGGQFGQGAGHDCGRIRAVGAARAHGGHAGALAAEALQRLLLLALETLLPQGQLFEIHQVAVEIGAIHAGEFHGAAHGYAAGTAHAGAIHHDGIQTDDGGDAQRAGDLAAGAHHGDRPDGYYFAGVLFLGEDIGEGRGDESFAAIAAVIGGDFQAVAEGAERLLPEDQVARAETDDGDGAIAELLVLAKLRKNGGHAEAAADQDDGAVVFADVARQAEWADEVEQVVALGEAHHLVGGFADRLDDDRDRAAGGIEIGDREGDALAVLVDAGHDEMAGARGACYIGRTYFPQKCCGAELLSADNRIHPVDPSFPGKRMISDFRRLWYCSTGGY